MNTDPIPAPHGGGGLVDRVIPEKERESFLKEAASFKSISISDADLSMFHRMADGALSPLEGPMSSDEFYRVLDEEVIERAGKKYAWAIPIALPVTREEKDILQKGETVAVKDERGEVVGSLEMKDIYQFDKARYNKSVYGTERTDHPGARIVNDDERDTLVGGKIRALPQHYGHFYEKYMLSPRETRPLFAERKWERIAAFQTRNPLHRAHEYAMVWALEKLTKEGYYAGAVLNPLVGATKSDDIPADVRMKTYEALIDNRLIGQGDLDEEFWKTKEYELDDQLLLIGLDVKMFYAGPKEAIMHAIYRQNYGFTDIVIGRKHADAPFDDGTPVWGDFDAHDKFDNLEGELLIKPVKVGFAAYFTEINRVGLVKEFKDKGYNTVSISGKELRRELKHGDPIDERIMRKPVADILEEFYRGK